MLTINASSLRASANDSAAPPATGGGDAAGFASLLRQTQVASAAPHQDAVGRDAARASAEPVPTKASNTDAEEARATEDADAASAANDPTGRTRAPAKTKARGADAASAHKPATAGDDEVKTPASGDIKPTDTTATAATAPIDPAVAQWLAALQNPAAAAATAERGTGTGTATDDAATALGSKKSAAQDLQAVDAKTQAAVNDKSGRGDDRFKAELAAVGSETARTEQRVTEPVPATTSAGVKGLDAANAAVFAPPQTAVREAAVPVAVAVPTPVNAPDFAQALGLQLSVLAKDGVQTAELHLNPADMGPVSVQIVMDGTQARVDFGADVAATRQAIEAGLPELASALRDAGFTLAGGGVSQHAGGRSAGGGTGSSEPRPDRRQVAPAEVQRVATAARRIVTAGGVDLFA